MGPAALGVSSKKTDPEQPVPYAGQGLLLTDLPSETIAALVEAFVGSSLLHVEVRQLGGAASVSSPDHGLLDRIEQPFVLFTFGLTPDPRSAMAVEQDVRALVERLEPWDSGRRYLNFAETRMDPRAIYGPGYERLRVVKATYDPAGLFVANHPVERMSTGVAGEALPLVRSPKPDQTAVGGMSGS